MKAQRDHGARLEGARALLEEDDSLPVDPSLLASSMFVGDVVAGHGVTPFIDAARGVGCHTAEGGDMVEGVQDLMADFMVGSSG